MVVRPNIVSRKLSPRVSINSAVGLSRIDKGFFHNIQGYFNQGFHGRYFAILLRELAQNEPTSFARLIQLLIRKSDSSFWHSVGTSLRKKQLTVQREYPFPGAGNKRR